MKNLKYLFTAICLISLLSGCYKDDSTSFQIPLADVTIASHEKIPFYVGVESNYTPTIEWGGTSEADYDYKWTLNGREVISNDLTLRYSFKEMGDAFLTFQMIDKKTGLVYGKDFSATVTAKYFLGWVILSEGAGSKSQLSFVDMDSFTSYPDIYAQANSGDELGTKPYGLANTCISKQDQIVVLQEGGEGPVSVSGLSFVKASYLKHEFIGEQFPESNFKAKSILFSHKGAEMLISESGKMYDRLNAKSRTTSSATFQDALFTTQAFPHIAGEYKFTHHTYPGSNNYYTALYDALNRRWLAYNHVMTGQKNIPAFVVGSTAKFADGFNYCTGMAEDVELVYAQSHGETGYKMNLTNILKKDGAYYINDALLTLASSNYRITVTALTQKDFATGYAIDENSIFCMPRGTGTDYNTDIHVFFNIGQKVYFYHFSTGLTYLYRDFSKEENAPQGNIVAITQRADTKQIAVTFSDGHLFIMDSQKTKLTAIRQNNLDPEKVDNGLVLAHISDIPGTPVATMFKCGKASNYTGAKVAY